MGGGVVAGCWSLRRAEALTPASRERLAGEEGVFVEIIEVELMRIKL